MVNFQKSFAIVAWISKFATVWVGISLVGAWQQKILSCAVPPQNLSSVTGTGGEYVVQSGDTLYDIARKYVKQSCRDCANGLTALYVAGWAKITIPAKQGYRVQKGDTLYKIAQKFSIGPYDIARANGLVAPFRIYPKQNLIIPTVFMEADPLPTRLSRLRLRKLTFRKICNLHNQRKW